MGISKVTRNFQITLPRDVRELKHISMGDEIMFLMDNNRVEITKREKSAVMATAGLWSDGEETGIEYERRLRKGWHKRRVK